MFRVKGDNFSFGFAVFLIIVLLTHKPANGFLSSCVVCTFAVRTVTVAAGEYEKTVDQIVNDFCSLLKNTSHSIVGEQCFIIWDAFGPEIVKWINSGIGADRICGFIGLCEDPKCQLLPENNVVPESFSNEKLPDDIEQLEMFLYSIWPDKRYIPTSILSKLMNRLPDSPFLPLVDGDDDAFSPSMSSRGAHWRGRDCDDKHSEVYPGRKSPPSTGKYSVPDHNCNGVEGEYQDEWCGDESEPRGVIIIGDSASARFHMSYDLTNPVLAYEMENSFDWPHCSWSTGFGDNDICEVKEPGVAMTSIYLKMFERNRCNHRDYQNVAHNGAETLTFYSSGLINTTARNPSTDYPVIVFFAPVGNDVCRYLNGSSHMVTREEFLERTLVSLDWLDHHLPRNSHVVFVGLEHGEQWKYMSGQIHPFFNITYGDFWSFADCNKGNPCWGWLNPDPYWRNFTSQRARALDTAYDEIIKTKNYNNFDMVYIENPDSENTKQWIDEGRDPSLLFEWLGGAHPSQYQNILTANAIWKELETKYPHIIGPVNPHNEDIAKKFGDQGGY